MQTIYSSMLGGRAEETRQLVVQLARLPARDMISWADVEAARRDLVSLRGESPRLLLVLVVGELTRSRWSHRPGLRRAAENLLMRTTPQAGESGVQDET